MPVVVSATPDLLDRLLGVLLDNACKYAPEGGTVAITTSQDGARAVVTVDDSVRASRTTSGNESSTASTAAAPTRTGVEGAGLGLAIADAIVRATGGRWSIGTAPQGGARFSVSWPRASLS